MAQVSLNEWVLHMEAAYRTHISFSTMFYNLVMFQKIMQPDKSKDTEYFVKHGQNFNGQIHIYL